MTGDGDLGHVLALASLPRMGPGRLDALLAGRDPRWVWEELRRGGHGLDPVVGPRCGSGWAEVRAGWTAGAVAIDPARLAAAHHGLLVRRRGEDGFPVRLADDPEPPAFLVMSADLPDAPIVAIVGTRRCSGYGRDVARELGRGLAAAGVAVASGLALGIDAAAHRGALDVDGAPPVGVVATGLDVVYPVRNRRLWSDVEERGALVTEQPLGTPPARWRFPARNRILAGLADVVVVVESHAAGGSMHTVTAALERDVAVLAVPGPVTSPASAGTNALLAEGAAPARHVDDVLTALGLRSTPVPAGARREVPAELRPVLDSLDATPTSIDAVSLRTGLDVVTLHGVLRRLAALDLAEEEAGWWRSLPTQRVGHRGP
ncbi:MAG: DNA-processing protein DprA [Actinomycetota bacterium]